MTHGPRARRTHETGDAAAPAQTPTVFVIDDDEAVRRALRMLLESDGHWVADYAGAQLFLARCDPACRGCVITDLRMPGCSGLELQAALEARGIALPVILLTAHGDVPAAVQSLQAGAFDFLEKPFDPQRLLARVRHAIALDAERSRNECIARHRDALLARLTPRERDVAERVAAGRSNKAVAADLGISERTVELHRGRAMRKLELRTLADLVRLLDAGSATPARG